MLVELFQTTLIMMIIVYYSKLFPGLRLSVLFKQDEEIKFVCIWYMKLDFESYYMSQTWAMQ